MKKNINRLILAAVSILLGAGTAKAADELKIEGSVAKATVAVYKANAAPTDAPTGAIATSIAPGEWIILKVTPNDGYWTYGDILTIQGAGSIGGAEGRTRGGIMVPQHPKALSGNEVDGTGYYYLQIPAEWKNADGYAKVIIGGEAIEKIDLSTATLSDKKLTATSGGWTVNITFDALSFTYTGSVQWPAIESFSLTNGGIPYSVYGPHVSISGSGRDAGTYTVTLTSKEHGCLRGTKTVNFEITQVAGYIKYNTTSVTKTYGDDAFTNSLLKFGDGTVKYSISPAGIATVDETTGKVTITGSGDATITATVTDGKNYTYATKTATYTLTVNPRDLSSATVSTTPDSYVYDGNPKTPGVTVVLGGKTLVKDTDYEVNFSNNTEAGSATVTVTGKGNYTGTALGSFTITSATGDLTFGDVTKTYGNAPFEVSPSTVISPGAISYASSNTAVVTVSGNTLTIVGAGSATITATQAASGSYAEQSKTFTVTVNQAALTVTAKNHDITYGDAPANNGVDYDGFVGTEDASVLGGTLTYNYNYTQYGNVGDSYTITPGGLTSGNYAISFVGGTLKVGQREVGLNWSTPTTFTFNGSAQAPTATATNTVNGDEISVTVTVSAKSGSSLTGGNAVNVGNYTAEATGLTGSKNGNYKLPDANTCDFSIGEAGMGEITVTGWNNTYDGAAHGITVNQPSGATVKYRTAASGEYNLTENPTFTDVCDQTVYYQVTKSGYTPVTGSAKVTINKAALTVTAKNHDITYGDAPANNGVTYSGFVNGETSAVLGGTLTYNYNYTQYGDVGDSYTITLGGLTSDNYAISFVGGTLKVGQREVGLNWSTPTTFTFNGSAQAPTASATGTVNGDEISVTVTVSAKSGSSLTGGNAINVGNYTAEATGLTGSKNGNYKLPDANTCDFSIGEAGMGEITVTEWNNTYDGAAHGITVNQPSGATVKYRTAASGEYNLTENPTFTDVCDKTVYYQVTKSGYTPVTGSAKVTINKAALTVTAKNHDITYGDAPANNGVDYDGFVGTEDASALGGTLTYNYNYTQYGNVGDSYTITPGGLTSGNYAISFVGGTLKVGQREVGLNWSTPTTFTFNGSAQAPTASATNTVNGDEIGVTVTGAQTAVGSGYIATASALTGDKSGNYKLPAAKTCEFSIGEAGMSGIDVTEWNQTYDGLAHGIVVTAPTGATVKYRTAASGEYNLTESPTFTDVCDKTVYYQVTKSGYTPVTGSAKVTINKAALTVTAKDKEITYGNAPANDGVTYSGFVNGETTSVLGGTLSYTYNSMANGTGSDYTPTSNIGTYYIIPSGLTSTNYDINFVTGTLKVNKAPATIATDPGSTSGPLVYNSAAQTLISSGSANGGTMYYRIGTSGDWSTTIPTGTNADTYNIYYKVVGDANHTDSEVSGPVSVTIGQKPLTITANANTIGYGAAASNAGVSYSGFAGTEDASVLSGTLTYTYNSMANGTGSDYTPTSNIGTYYIIPGGLTSTNYAITFVAGELTVNAKSISSATVSASPASFVYDGSAKTPDVTVILDGKTLIKGTDYEITGYENNTGAGEATVIVTGKGNYQGTVNGSFTITPAEGELAFNPITKTYGDAPFEVAPSTKQSNGDITYSSGNPAVVTVSGNILTIVGFGEATITAHQAASGSYAEETKTFKVTVNKAPLTVKADNKTITYGDAVPVFTVSDENYTGFVYGETKAVLGGTLAFDCTYAQYGDANTYTVTPKNLTSNNYDITFSPGTLTVDQKEVGLMWTNTELTYNATAQKPTVTVTETVNGDEIGVTVTGEKIYVGTGYLATATTLTGAKADNYKLPAVNTQTFSIGQRTLTITANDQTIDYGTAIATGITLVTPTGLQGTDALTAVTLMASTGEVTSDGTINPSGVKIENSGVDMTANYNINLVPGTLIIEYVLNLNAGYCTFCSPFDLLLTGGLKAYTVSAVREDNVYLTEQNAIGKNVAMILYIETAGTLKLRKAPSQDFSSDNTFVGVTDAAGINVEQINGEMYILKDGKFVWSREGVVPQYRCYVVISHAAAARSMGIVVDGETSGIDNLLLSDEEDGNWYSLDGRKLDGKPTAKGIYIMIPADGRSKGKKVMIK